MSTRSTRSTNQPSNQGKRFSCASSPNVCAGLLGLPDVDSLKAVINSAAFQSIYKQYASKRQAPWNLSTIKIPKVFDMIEYQGARRGYGAVGDTLSTEGWTANDWMGHYIVMLQQAVYPDPTPKWGPLPGEKNLEAWNRIWQLVRLTNWSNTPSIKPKFWREGYPNLLAKVPEFMKSGSSRTQPCSTLPDETIYTEYDWKLTWHNFALVQERLRAEMGQGIRKDVPPRRSQVSKMPDPRRWEGEDWRDKIRREWDMKRLHLDIDSLNMEVAGPTGTISWSCIEDYATVQRICRDDNLDKDTIKFELCTKFVDVDMDIYERMIPVGLEEFYLESPNGLVKQRATTDGDEDLQDDLDEGLIGANLELQPDDFHDLEENPLEFDPKDPANIESLVAWQDKTLTAMASNRVVTRSPQFHTASQEELDDLRTGGALSNLIAEEPLSSEQLQEFAQMMRARGAERNIGPNYHVACDNLGFRPFSDVPQLPGTDRALRPVQIIGVAWMVAQCYGQVPRVANFNHRHPTYRRPAMRGGLIGDDMGMGKTVQTLAFIDWMSENYNNFGVGTSILPHQNIQAEGEPEFRPSLVIAPTSVAYQWVDEIQHHWEGLKAYLFHGRNDGKLGAKYKHLRILGDDLKAYAGDITKDPIRADLKPLFDKKNRDNLKVIVVAAYDAFRDRAKVVEQDEDEVELLSSRFSDVFGHIFCDEGHAMRNPLTKKFKVIKASHCFSCWLLAGTPLLNRESDLIGLSTFLWHEDFKRPLTDARLAEVLDPEYDIFDQTLDNEDPAIRFRAHPSRVRQIFQKKDSKGNADLLHQKQRLPMVLDLLLLRRAQSTKLSAGPNRFLIAGASIPPYQIRTLVLDTPPKHAAERQLATFVYVNNFLSQLKAAGIPEIGAAATAASQKGRRYPSKWLRRLCLVSTSLTIDRLVKRQELNGMTVLAGDILEWRARGVDYRWIADKVRTRGDPVLNTKEDYLLFLASLNEKLKYLCWMIREMYLKGPNKDRKLCIFFEWPASGFELEKVFEALYLKVAIVHAGTPEAERISIREAFCDPKDKSIQFLLISYRISGFGLNLQGDCHTMVLYEQAININSELQAIFRIHRIGQRKTVFITRLVSKNTIDSYRNFKQGEKMLSEVIGWSAGAVAERVMKHLILKAGVSVDTIDLEDPNVLREAAWAVIRQLRGSDEQDGESSTPHIDYYALSKRTLAVAEIEADSEEEARRKKH